MNKLIYLKNNFLFLLSVLCSATLLVFVFSCIFLITLPLFFLFWKDDIFNFYQKNILRFYDMLFETKNEKSED